MIDKRKRTKRMPLGTWFWMPFFERGVQTVLARIKAKHGDELALWAYCECASIVVERDPKSFNYSAKAAIPLDATKPNQTGRGTSFELLYRIIGSEAAELLCEVSESQKLIRKSPKRRHQIAAWSEAKSVGKWVENETLGITKFGGEKALALEILDMFTSSKDADSLIGWDELAESKGRWTVLNLGKWAEAERKRREQILKQWECITVFAPEAILPNLQRKTGSIPY